jgi:hypothetical protein
MGCPTSTHPDEVLSPLRHHKRKFAGEDQRLNNMMGPRDVEQDLREQFLDFLSQLYA